MVLVETPHPEWESPAVALLSEEQRQQVRTGPEYNPEGVRWDASGVQVCAAGRAAEMPLVVLTRGARERWPDGWPGEGLEQLWQERQADLVTCSAQGTPLIADKSGANIPQTQPELVVAAVRQVMAQTQR